MSLPRGGSGDRGGGRGRAPPPRRRGRGPKPPRGGIGVGSASASADGSFRRGFGSHLRGAVRGGGDRRAETRGIARRARASRCSVRAGGGNGRVRAGLGADAVGVESFLCKPLAYASCSWSDDLCDQRGAARDAARDARPRRPGAAKPR